MKRKKILLLSFSFLMLFLAIGTYFFFSNESKELQIQEQKSEQVANEYLMHIQQQMLEEPEDTIQKNFEYKDNKLFSYHTEDSALGHVDSVLEIPKIGLRQSIYTGTKEEIMHDLNEWLPVTARHDYKLGETRYCIYMHNPADQSITISKAQYYLKTNDYIVVTKERTVYLYKILDVYSEWRDKCTDQFVNNDDIDKTKLMIFTCGKDEWKGTNVVIDAELYKTYELKDWIKNKDLYIKEYNDNFIEEKQEVIKDKKKPLILTIEQIENENSLIVHLSIEITREYKEKLDCSIGVFNEDGYLTKIHGNPFKISDKSNSVKITNLPEGNYFIGVYENNTDFDNPSTYTIKIKEQQRVEIETIKDEIKKETTFIKIFITIVCTSIVIIASVFIFKATKRKK